MKRECGKGEGAKQLALDEPLLRLIDEFRRAQGFDISMYDAAFLRQAIARRIKETGCLSVAAYGGLLCEHRVEAETFEHSLTIAHSEFFRNALTFAILEQRVLPALIARKKQTGCGEIRVWSAGCAAGQEAWSVALLLEELTAATAPVVPYRLFATDRSACDLAYARAGHYSAEAVGNVRSRHLRDFFSLQGEAFVVDSRLRARVDFSIYDLLDEQSLSPDASIYGDFDLILCCNLLFYYRPGIRQQILKKLRRALSPGGYFVTGEVERDSVTTRDGLRPVDVLRTVFQKSI
jgi:chemotaxis methyl-accepting protein methylase